MKTKELIDRFLSFFENLDHKILDSSPLVLQNDPSMMFVNSGMVQFKKWFTRAEEPLYKSVATCQRCVRAGGKHNDLENVGYTTRHHTFFQMLGNFSFDNYFKEEAILYAWKFLEELGINKNKLMISVYHDDEEAFDLCRKITNFSESKILKIKSNDNFWSMGNDGPCGPCMDIFYDNGEEFNYSISEYGVDGDRFVEIWSLVFMQYEKLCDGKLIELPKKCIDTGIGVERLAAALQGVTDNFHIDIFLDIIDGIFAAIRDIGYFERYSDWHQLPLESKRMLKIVADHMRAACFMMYDNVSVSNEGRGYVLRRIIRRAMRYLYMHGIKEPILDIVAVVVMNRMSEVCTVTYNPQISVDIRKEEERFGTTLTVGMRILQEHLLKLPAGEQNVLSGDVVFQLHDTYGFPYDIIKDTAKEHNMQVEEERFELLLLQQKQRSKINSSFGDSQNTDVEHFMLKLKESGHISEMMCYQVTSDEDLYTAKIIGYHKIVDKESYIVVFDATPFYPESGGQTGDSGYVIINGEKLAIINTIVISDVIGHVLAPREGIYDILSNADTAVLSVNYVRRKKIAANHSATHIMQKVMRDILGTHIVQKGSSVTSERLRFDFASDVPLSNEQRLMIETRVNAVIRENLTVIITNTDYNTAMQDGVLSLAEELYGDEVRVVRIGSSAELCCGTHVNSTGEIGIFKIVGESAVASGIRRIECVTAESAFNLFSTFDEIVKTSALLLKCKADELSDRVKALQCDYKSLEKEVNTLRVKEIINKADVSEQEFVFSGAISAYIYAVCIEGPSKVALSEAAREIKKRLNACNVLPKIFLIYQYNVASNIALLDVFAISLENSVTAKDIADEMLDITGGKGGGNAFTATIGNIETRFTSRRLLDCFVELYRS
ncbi:Alanine--tRNA ligase [Candidatus Fokinia solitaria]|uniref:Alanine--tRNA ligase n=1 Tax=Candidatus Fokinia solitaria TaxID=1802984 RepID=A0A2U8BSL0_9RICK|nr:alanine--tRNA ligase [Candidatus Fokinia solitaria]AWD33344.1 Alanine--tRNA ligase [Candidatus Fokinia solitaria]